MIGKEGRRLMKDYVMDHLDSDSKPKLYMRGDIDAIIVSEGMIFLVDQKYGQSDFVKFYQGAKSITNNSAFLFYKDGETFFRSVLSGEEKTGLNPKWAALSPRGTLRKYRDQKTNLISSTPEEKYLFDRTKTRLIRPGVIQYYQPNSPRLEQGIEDFHFKNVIYDYTLLNDDTLPPTEVSEKVLLWDERRHNNGRFRLLDGILVPSN